MRVRSMTQGVLITCVHFVEFAFRILLGVPGRTVDGFVDLFPALIPSNDFLARFASSPEIRRLPSVVDVVAELCMMNSSINKKNPVRRASVPELCHLSA